VVEVGHTHAALAQLCRRFDGTGRLTGIQQALKVRQTLLVQALAQVADGIIRCASLFGLEQIIPGGCLVSPAVLAVAALRERARKLPNHFISTFVPVCRRLGQKALCLLQAAVLKGLLSLPQY